MFILLRQNLIMREVLVVPSVVFYGEFADRRKTIHYCQNPLFFTKPNIYQIYRGSSSIFCINMVDLDFFQGHLAAHIHESYLRMQQLRQFSIYMPITLRTKSTHENRKS